MYNQYICHENIKNIDFELSKKFEMFYRARVWLHTVGVKLVNKIFFYNRGRRGRDHMVVGFITTYAISAYHH
jgi:hypothetical protein